MVLHLRQTEPRIHPLFPDRVARRRKGRRVERAHCHSADRRVAISFPIECAAAVRAEMKSNAVAAVGVAFVELPLAFQPHLLFPKRRAEMERSASAALARSEEHTSELQSHLNLVCRLLLEKKKKKTRHGTN